MKWMRRVWIALVRILLSDFQVRTSLYDRHNYYFQLYLVLIQYIYTNRSSILNLVHFYKEFSRIHPQKISIAYFLHHEKL